LTIYIGEETKNNTSANTALEEYIRENFADTELDIANGGQAVYHYIFSAE